MRRLLVLALTGLLLTGMLPAGAVPTPLVAKNLELVTTIPDVGAISTAFSRSKPLMYVNTLNGVSIYNISKPESPQLISQLPLPHFSLPVVRDSKHAFYVVVQSVLQCGHG